MKVRTASRIVRDMLCRRGLRQSYWEVRKTGIRLAQLLRPGNRTFTYYVVQDTLRFFLQTVRPIRAETRVRARAAVDWILRAQEATADDGVSVGYFPCDAMPGWRASYPETTGYIIPSLLEFARRYGDEQVRQRALRMARWEVGMQMGSGAVQGGPVRPQQQTPASFNTGMVLDGWSAAYRDSGDSLFLEAGRRAAEFLLNDLQEDGFFRTHGPFVVPARVKVYTCLCAWAMYRYGEDAGEYRYQEAAVRLVETALQYQHANGWFANNCLTWPEAPLLHTIGYTLQGILEVGMLAGRRDFMAAVRRGVDPLLARISRAGFIASRFYADWEPAAFSACLTGSAQLAIVCYKLAAWTGNPTYCTAADRLVNYLKALQILDAADKAINGALAGSFPLFGSYMTAGYPNWATKYFLDSLMIQDRLHNAGDLAAPAAHACKGLEGAAGPEPQTPVRGGTRHEQ